MIKSYAKLNLSLRVLKKLKNGLHNLQSNSFLVDLHDKILVEKIKKKKDRIFTKGKFCKYLNKKENSIIKTLKYLRLKKIISGYYKITITKNIPIFSGLGGGTSNAAFLTKFFFHKKKINNSIIKNISNIVGSDFPLFFETQVYMKSLNQILPFKKKYKLYMLLIFPRFRCSTKKIYSKIKSLSKPSKVDYSKSKTKNLFIESIKKEKNDLQIVVEQEFPTIKKIIKFIAFQKACCFSRMTGSGSVCFGVFKNRKFAIEAKNNIKKKYPSYWVKITKTI